MLKALNDFKASALALKLCNKCQPSLHKLIPESKYSNANDDSDVEAKTEGAAANANICHDQNQA